MIIVHKPVIQQINDNVNVLFRGGEIRTQFKGCVRTLDIISSNTPSFILLRLLVHPGLLGLSLVLAVNGLTDRPFLRLHSSHGGGGTSELLATGPLGHSVVDRGEHGAHRLLGPVCGDGVPAYHHHPSSGDPVPSHLVQCHGPHGGQLHGDGDAVGAHHIRDPVQLEGFILLVTGLILMVAVAMSSSEVSTTPHHAGVVSRPVVIAVILVAVLPHDLPVAVAAGGSAQGLLSGDVVQLPLLGVSQDGVDHGDLTELIRVLRVLVRVILDGELPVSPLHLIVIRFRADSQDVIVLGVINLLNPAHPFYCYFSSSSLLLHLLFSCRSESSKYKLV